jgi:sialate O-acetylesterase
MKNLLLPILLFTCLFSIAQPRLPKIFGDNMVLQRKQDIPVWGWAGAGEKITVQFNHQSKSSKADRNGKWMLKLDPEEAGGPYQLLVKGKKMLTVNNVLVGEVWICSGQSNMEFPVSGVNNAAKEIAAADYPTIREIRVGRGISTIPKEDLVDGEWAVCSPATVGEFTAVGYFFARELYNRLKIPIGLINSSWGGTHSETWTSRGAFESSNDFKSMIATMPQLNLDSLAEIRKQSTVKQIESLQGHLPSAAEKAGWKEAATDDSRWPTMRLPQLWDYQQLGALDGVVWFRKTLNITNENAGKAAELDLAMIDDNDITYVNGVRVGATNVYNAQRKYLVPAGVLKAGNNLIAVRVEDTGGGGGIYGDSSDLRLRIGTEVLSLAGEWAFQVEAIYAGANSIGPNSFPTLLFNTMINPLIPFAIEGAIWYQGEANADRAYEYRKAFPLMITDWRQHWGRDFPFYFVQLASFNSANGNSKNGSTWAELREAQTMTLSLPNTGMSVTTDIGESNDIHPRNKQDVGWRLSVIALDNIYGIEMESSGPLFQSMKVEGNQAIISFVHVGKGLEARDKYGYLRGFEIAAAGGDFHYAMARVEGDHVIVSCNEVRDPVAVRFAWADDAGEANLFNKDGLPAVPFRTDQWKGITEGNKFTIEK